MEEFKEQPEGEEPKNSEETSPRFEVLKTRIVAEKRRIRTNPVLSRRFKPR